MCIAYPHTFLPILHLKPGTFTLLPYFSGTSIIAGLVLWDIWYIQIHHTPSNNNLNEELLCMWCFHVFVAWEYISFITKQMYGSKY